MTQNYINRIQLQFIFFRSISVSHYTRFWCKKNIVRNCSPQIL